MEFVCIKKQCFIQDAFYKLGDVWRGTGEPPSSKFMTKGEAATQVVVEVEDSGRTDYMAKTEHMAVDSGMETPLSVKPVGDMTYEELVASAKVFGVKTGKKKKTALVEDLTEIKDALESLKE